MASITVTPAEVRPIDPHVQSVIVKGQAGGAGSVGDAVYLDSNFVWQLTDADAEASAWGRGVVVATGIQGYTTFASGDMLDIVVYGPVFLGASAAMTGGSNALVYNSVTPGDMDQTASVTTGDFPSILGWPLTATVLFVDPQKTLPVVL